MKNLWALPTTNDWNENVFKVTPFGFITIIVLIIVLINLANVVHSKDLKENKVSTKRLVFSSAAIAIAFISSTIKIIDMPLGGSVTLLSMFFITLIGYWYGLKTGIITGIAYGLLQFIVDPVFYSIPQLIVDYPLAFGALGLSGLFSNQKYGLHIGYIIGILGRLFFAFLSGLIFFASYASSYNLSAPAYSFLYNASYIFTEGLITIIVISIPSVSKAISHIKKLAISN